MFESIFIRNIKGFDGNGKTITLRLNEKKYNICFAPNGFGKTSIATAFSMLAESPTKLKPNKKTAFHNDETLTPEIRIRLDEKEYKADSIVNEIMQAIRCHVISSRVGVTTTHQNRGTYSHVEGVLDINDVVVFDKIPKSLTVTYRVTDMKKAFGENGKVLSNRHDFTSHRFLKALTQDSVKNALNHILNTKGTRKYLEQRQNEINLYEGRACDIRRRFDSHADFIRAFRSYHDIDTLMSELSDFIPDHHSNTDAFEFIWQLLHFWENNRSHITAVVKYQDYISFKESFTKSIAELNPTWREICVVEKNNQLVVEFPQAMQISNGQRDFLTFVADITKVKSDISLTPTMAHIVVIDEILDYLDDANMIALQHYLSDGLIDTSTTVYTCLLTHLSPYSFRSYIFSDKKVNHVFLDTSTPQATEGFLSFIAFRESLDRKNKPDDKNLYDSLSSYFFHYNPDTTVDLSDQLKSRKSAHVKTSWGKVENLKQAMIDEVNSYLSGLSMYDPYAVCMALRHRVEKVIYGRLPDNVSKDRFIATHLTKQKFVEAENSGVEIPEIFNLITALHNEADHVKINGQTNQYMEKRIVYSLRHPIIRNLIAKIFEYDGTTPLHITTIR